jgi:hypothetical protein
MTDQDVTMVEASDDEDFIKIEFSSLETASKPPSKTEIKPMVLTITRKMIQSSSTVKPKTISEKINSNQLKRASLPLHDLPSSHQKRPRVMNRPRRFVENTTQTMQQYPQVNYFRNPCIHKIGSECHLSSNLCCACLDKRPYNETGLYECYVDGVGTVSEVRRWAYYCTPCQRK